MNVGTRRAACAQEVGLPIRLTETLSPDRRAGGGFPNRNAWLGRRFVYLRRRLLLGGGFNRRDLLRHGNSGARCWHRGKESPYWHAASHGYFGNPVQGNWCDDGLHSQAVPLPGRGDRFLSKWRSSPIAIAPTATPASAACSGRSATNCFARSAAGFRPRTPPEGRPTRLMLTAWSSFVTASRAV